MITFDRVKELADKQGKSLNKVEDDLGFARNSLYALKRNKPSVDRITKLADYFHVTESYLLGREEAPDVPDLTIDQILDSVENYSGGELNESDREMLRIIIEAKKAAMDKETKK